jgi:hypothetical protein
VAQVDNVTLVSDQFLIRIIRDIRGKKLDPLSLPRFLTKNIA